MPRRRVLILVFAVALVAAAWLRRPATALTIAPLDASAPSFTHAFAVGRRLVYEVDYRTEALVDGNLQRGPKGEGAPRADNLLTLSSVIGGKLTLTVVERRGDDSARVLATLTELVVDVVVTGRALALPEETFAPLARGFFVDYGPVGDVRGIAVEADTHPIAGRLASQVLAFLQLEAPPGHGDAWEMDEKDPLGELHARYSVLADKPSHDAGQLIQKLVARRGVPRTSGALARLVASGGTLGTSTLAYEVSPARGILLEAAGALTTEQVIGDLRVGTDDSTIVIRYLGEEASDAVLVRAQVAEREAVLGGVSPLEPGEARALDRRKENEALLARIDLPAVVADARARPPPPQSREAATYARLLTAAVDVSPEARAFLEKTMLEPAIGERAFVPLARAFGEASSPEAQAALLRVIDGRPKNDPGREVALFSLGRADAPTDATVARLESLSNAKDDPHAYAALLALGRIAGQVVATDPKRGAPVVERLLARVENAASDTDRAQTDILWGTFQEPDYGALKDLRAFPCRTKTANAANYPYDWVVTTRTKAEMAAGGCELASVSTGNDVYLGKLASKWNPGTVPIAECVAETAWFAGMGIGNVNLGKAVGPGVPSITNEFLMALWKDWTNTPSEADLMAEAKAQCESPRIGAGQRLAVVRLAGYAWKTGGGELLLNWRTKEKTTALEVHRCTGNGFDWWVQTNKAVCPGGYKNGNTFFIAK